MSSALEQLRRELLADVEQRMEVQRSAALALAAPEQRRAVSEAIDRCINESKRRVSFSLMAFEAGVGGVH